MVPRLTPGIARYAGPALGLIVLGCAAAGGGLKTGTPEEEFAAAKREYDEGHYFDAVLKLNEFIDRHPGSILLDQAIVTLGFAHLAQKDWALAAVEFERLVRDFPESRSACDAEFALGECYWRQARKPSYDQTETRQALDQFNRALTRCPDHPRRAETERSIAVARDRLADKLLKSARLYQRLGQPEAAIIYSSLVVSDYPESRWVCSASQLKAELLVELGRRDEARAELDWLRERCTQAGDVQGRVEELEQELARQGS